MELRQLRYFVRVVELGSMGRAAADLNTVTSALSQQIGKLENELSTRLLHRTSTGVAPTDAGMAFWRQAQLTLRHADAAVQAAQQPRLSGHVSVGLAPTTSGVLGLPFMHAMRERYPQVRLHLVEALSGDLTSQLNARRLDLAVLFHGDANHAGHVMPLLEERLFLIGSRSQSGMPAKGPVRLSQLGNVPLIMPTGSHGLRALLDQAFTRTGRQASIVAEIDGLAMLMDAVRGGFGATIQPGAALSRFAEATGLSADVQAATLAEPTPNTSAPAPLVALRIADGHAVRPNLLVGLPDEELSPAALAARVVLRDVARDLVAHGKWRGARLHES